MHNTNPSFFMPKEKKEEYRIDKADPVYYNLCMERVP